MFKSEDVDKYIVNCKYPIRKYYRNVLDLIENKCGVDKSAQIKAIASNKVSAGIGFILETPIGDDGPYFDLDRRQIIFSESFYGFLWATINWLYTTFEKIYIENNNAICRGEPFEISEGIRGYINKSRDLFYWGQVLRKEYISWPEEMFPLDNQDPWISKVSNIWISAIGFVFYHEYAHAIDIKNEKEADAFAINNVCLSSNPKTDKLCNILGALGATSALFFFIELPELIKQDDHPDIDDRLNDLIIAIQGQLKEDDVRYVKMFATFSIAMFFNVCDVPANFKRSNDAHQMWDNILEYCKDLKINLE